MVEVKLTTAGPVQQGTYLPRPSDHHLLNACKAGQFSYILASRQIGKSSLMYKTAEALSIEGVKTAIVDLNRIGRYVQEADTWYYSLIDELAHRLNLRTDVEAWWNQRPALASSTQRFLRFLEEVVVTEIREPIVIFIDEIDVTLGLDFTDDFFAAIRAVHHDRAQNPEFERLTFVLLGVATPDELIASPSRTPFNIGQEIRLRDFTLAECTLLRQPLAELYTTYGDHYYEQIYAWTAGHPYLTQRLCYDLCEGKLEERVGLVDDLVEKRFLEPRGRGDPSLQFVQDRVADDPYAQQMLRLYKQILQGDKPVLDNAQSTPINRLKLYGLVVVENDHLITRNKLYETIFDLTWIDEMLYQTGQGIPNRYKILQETGKGGIARVYSAQPQEGNLPDLVALKVFDLRDRSETEWREWLDRFNTQRALIEQLDHPHIMHIFETGLTGQQTIFLVMEYFSRGTLRRRLQDGPLSLEEAVTITRQIGSALSHAHQNGLLHRDVKPGNILLDSNEPLRVVLSDFGLVDLLPQQNLLARIKRQELRATAHYLAPEQWHGESWSPATDTYALAITFFEMVTGRLPFNNGSMADLEQKHLQAELPVLARFLPNVGSFFDRVLKKATAKQAADRHRSVQEFVDDLSQAYEQTIRSGQEVKQAKAGDLVRAAQSYMEYEEFNPEIALTMIEGILDLTPEHQDALRLKGKIKLKQGAVDDALAIYQQAYQQDTDPYSTVGQEYLTTLNQVATAAWQTSQKVNAIPYYEKIMEIWGQHFYKDVRVEQSWQDVRTRLIDYYSSLGQQLRDEIEAQTIDLETAISRLQTKILQLENLGADQAGLNLSEILRDLRIQQQIDTIEYQQEAIRQLLDVESLPDFKSEVVFNHYQKLDDAYQTLIEIEPDNVAWPEARLKARSEQADTRHTFAQQTAATDYEIAIRHYRGILSLEETKYPPIYLEQRIASLEKLADHDGKYEHIRQLMEQGFLPKALERLEHDFIHEGNYDYQDVARLFWELVYARQHDGRFPPERAFPQISKRFLGLQLSRVQALKRKLEPWLDLSVQITAEEKQLNDHKTEIDQMETFLQSMSRSDMDVTSEAYELEKIKLHLTSSRDLLAGIIQNADSRQLEDWHTQIDQLMAELQQDDLLLKEPDFLADSDKRLLKIEQNSLLEDLQLFELTNRDLNQKIMQLNSRLQDYELGRLVDQCRQLEMSRAGDQASLASAEGQISQLQAEIGKINQERANLQAEIDRLNRQIDQAKAENTRLMAEVTDLTEVKDDMERVIAETHEITFKQSKTERLLEKLHQRHTSYIVIILIVAFLATLTGTMAMTLFLPSYAAVISGLILLGVIIYALWLYFTDLRTTE